MVDCNVKAAWHNLNTVTLLDVAEQPQRHIVVAPSPQRSLVLSTKKLSPHKITWESTKKTPETGVDKTDNNINPAHTS